LGLGKRGGLRRRWRRLGKGLGGCKITVMDVK
jgi:hypothetical protein